MLNEELVTIFADHSISLQRIATTEGNKVIPYLDKIKEQVKKRFDREVGKNLTPLRKKKLQEDIAEITRTNLAAYVKELKFDNKAISKNEVVFTAKSVESVINADVAAVIPTASAVNAAVVGTPIKISEGRWVSYNNMMNSFVKEYTDQIDAIAMQGFIGGKTTDKIVNELMTEVSSTLTRAKKSAESTAITSLNHVANMARKEYYQDNDFVIGYRLLAVIDSRTSQTCFTGETEFHPIGDLKRLHRAKYSHPRCRTAESPEIDGRYSMDDDSDKRITNFVKDGRRSPKGVDSKQTYYEAFAKMSAADQDRVLGPTMGKAFRKLKNPNEFAKLTIDKLGNPYTIEEMTKRDNALGEILKAQRK